MTSGYAYGQYRVMQKLGEGAMGEVFLGMDTMLDREVALKVLRQDLARQPQVVDRFRAEAKILAQMHHPNIAAVHAMVREGDCFCIVMEYVPGVTLDERLRKRGVFAFADAMGVFSQILAAVGHAHNLNIIHRDLKPGNLMLTPRGEVKVMDFGIARALGTRRMTGLGRIVGTLEYMSPEQVRGQEATVSSDIYSLGIVLYEMLTGEVPFCSQSEFDLMRAQLEAPPPSPRMRAPWLSPQAEWALMHALEKQPEGRFRSTAEFASALCAPATTPDIVRTPPPATKLAFSPTIEPARPAGGIWTVKLYQWRTSLSFQLTRIRLKYLPNLLTWLRKYYYTPAVLFVVLCILVALAMNQGGGSSPTIPALKTLPASSTSIPAAGADENTPRPAPAEPLLPPQPQPSPPDETTPLPGNKETSPQPQPAAGAQPAPTKPKSNATKGVEKALDYLKNQE
jgi:serine/threonine protein kinase